MKIVLSEHTDAAARHVAAAARAHTKAVMLQAGAERWVYDVASDSFDIDSVDTFPRVTSAEVTTDPELSAAYAKLSA